MHTSLLFFLIERELGANGLVNSDVGAVRQPVAHDKVGLDHIFDSVHGTRHRYASLHSQFVCDGLEGERFIGGEVSQNLTVQTNVRPGECVGELSVAQTVVARSRANSGNPLPPVDSGSFATSSVSVLQRLLDLLDGYLVAVLCSAVKALRELEVLFLCEASHKY